MSDALALMSQITTIDKLLAFEHEMRKHEQLELLTEHFISPGIYTRVLHIPKGCLLTGKIHKQPILNIMLKGDISVLLGNEVRRIVAPFICVSPAGSKKIGFAHEDTIWAGCHGTNETDVEAIERLFIAQTEDEFLRHVAKARQLVLPLEPPKCG
jgi:hypothetical protein